MAITQESLREWLAKLQRQAAGEEALVNAHLEQLHMTNGAIDIIEELLREAAAQPESWEVKIPETPTIPPGFLPNDDDSAKDESDES